jgi:hypothetical protein
VRHCHLCRWSGGHHDKACPAVAEDKTRALADHRRGWDAGRAGNNLPEAESPAYKLGWINGTSALEAAENGHDPRFDG